MVTRSKTTYVFAEDSLFIELIEELASAISFSAFPFSIHGAVLKRFLMVTSFDAKDIHTPTFVHSSDLQPVRKESQ
jgi:hypothetical protein